MMQISFVRVQGLPDRVYVRRTDGGETSWAFPTYGNELPHDLVHLVVEAAFGVRNGLWGRVNAGVDVARVNAQANRTSGKNKYAGFGEDLTEIYLAEGLAGISWLNIDLSDEERLSALRESCARYGLDVPASVTAERLREVREKLLALRARWRTLVPKGALKLSFDPAAPEQSFAAFG